MDLSFIKRIWTIESSDPDIRRQGSALQQIIALFGIAMGTALTMQLLSIAFRGKPFLLLIENFSFVSFVLPIIALLGIAGISLWLTKHGKITPAMHLFFLPLTAFILVTMWRNGIDNIASIPYLLLFPVFGSAVIAGLKHSLAYAGIALLQAPFVFQLSGDSPLPYVIAFVVLTLIVWMLARNLQTANEKNAALAKNLQRQVDAQTAALHRRATQLQLGSEVGRASSATLDPAKIMRQTLQIIQEQFGYYHASIFLVEPNRQTLFVKESTGEVGKLLKKSPHRLKIAPTSLVGWAAGNLQARIAANVKQDDIYFSNPLLPDTKAEIALPLIARGGLLGVLDVQSSQLNAFQEEDVATLQIMADQLAGNLENARLYAKAEQSAALFATLPQVGTVMSEQSDNVNVINALAGNLAKRLQTTYADGWLWNPLTNRFDHLIRYHEGDRKLMDKPLGLSLNEVADLFPNNQPFHVNDRQNAPAKLPAKLLPSDLTENHLIAPIFSDAKLHGWVVLTRDGTNPFQVEEIQFTEASAALAQAAFAKNNLLTEANKVAEREMLVNSLSAAIHRNLDIHDLLNATAEYVGKAVGNRPVRVRLFGAETEDSSDSNGSPII